MRPKKKQRTSRQGDGARGVKEVPLGSRTGLKCSQLTDEELQLTASLFGSAADPARKPVGGQEFPGLRLQSDSLKTSTKNEEETGLEGVADDQLFAIDAAGPSDLEDSSQSLVSDTVKDNEEISLHGELRRDGDVSWPGPSQRTTTTTKKSSVWNDASTSSLLVRLAGPNARAVNGSLAGTQRLRKLRITKDEREISGREYELRLRQQYEKLHPRPAWASKNALGTVFLSQDPSKSIETSKKSSVQSISKSISLSQLLSCDAGLVARVTGSTKSRTAISSGSIEIMRLRDVLTGLDDSALSSAIDCLEFHPMTRGTACVLMTASRDRRVRFFNVDGSANTLLQTVHVPSLPISTASFHPNGYSLLLSGPRPFLYSYDLQAGRITRSSPWRVASSGGCVDEENSKERNLSMARFQPLDSSGASQLLAIGGRRGAIHIIDWARSGGASGGSLIASSRHNSPLAGLEWDPRPEADGRKLLSLGQDGTMNLWDVRNMRCSLIKQDLGLFGSRGIVASRGGGYWAVGSDSGIVNMYRGTDFQGSKGRNGSAGAAAVASASNSTAIATEEAIQAVKSISNLITSTSTLRFNPATTEGLGDSELMAVASRNKKDALRLVHLGSLTVYSNWPTSGTPLGHVNDVAFDPTGRYLAVGNTRGRTLLYGLGHFAA